MSDNPYSPPSARLGRSDRGASGAGDFDIGRCFSDGWTQTWENFPLWLGAGFVWLLALTLSLVTVIGIVLVPALAWGATRFVIRMYDGGAEFNDIFSGFSNFSEAFRSIGLLMLVTLGLSMAASSVQFLGAATGADVLVGLGYLVSLAFNLLVMPRLYFAFFYVVDRGESGSEALRNAWSDTEVCKWKVVLLALLAYPILFAGALLLLVGMIPASVIWYLMYVSAYRQMAGGPDAESPGAA